MHLFKAQYFFLLYLYFQSLEFLHKTDPLSEKILWIILIIIYNDPIIYINTYMPTPSSNCNLDLDFIYCHGILSGNCCFSGGFVLFYKLYHIV